MKISCSPLSFEQQQIQNKIDVGADIWIIVDFYAKNKVTSRKKNILLRWIALINLDYLVH